MNLAGFNPAASLEALELMSAAISCMKAINLWSDADVAQTEFDIWRESAVLQYKVARLRLAQSLKHDPTGRDSPVQLHARRIRQMLDGVDDDYTQWLELLSRESR